MVPISQWGSSEQVLQGPEETTRKTRKFMFTKTARVSLQSGTVLNNLQTYGTGMFILKCKNSNIKHQKFDLCSVFEYPKDLTANSPAASRLMWFSCSTLNAKGVYRVGSFISFVFVCYLQTGSCLDAQSCNFFSSDSDPVWTKIVPVSGSSNITIITYS